MWIYLNPNFHAVGKAALFDFLLLLMFNIGHQSNAQVQTIIAEYLVKYYSSMNISLTKFLGECDTDTINAFIMSIDPHNFKLGKLVTCFKNEHSLRFSNRMQD